MTRMEITGGVLIVRVEGVDKILALKSQLEVPLSHVISAEIDPGVEQEFNSWFTGLKAPGTGLPGVIKAGTWYTSDGKVFWDVHDPHQTVTIRLDHESYNRLVIQVADPAATVAMIEEAIRGQ
ncbi:MAG: hypothetical protein NVS3B14_22240 [Ktedonobacteraceae bacterium]